MPNQSKEFEIYMQRLDVICEVTKFILQPGQRASKNDFKILYNAAQKVVDSYERNDNAATSG